MTIYRLLDNLAALLSIPLLVIGLVALSAGWNSPGMSIIGGSCLLAVVVLWVLTHNASLRHAERGDGAAKLELAKRYLLGSGISQDEGEGFQWVERAANQGHVLSYFALAELFLSGRGTSRDYERAMHWYQKAADNGFAAALVQIGGMHEDGLGVPQNIELALDYYRRAAALDVPEAIATLGLKYEQGLGVSTDFIAARCLYESAAAKNLPDAWWLLARLSYYGRGTKQDLAQAVQLFKKAARMGSKQAQFDLARLYLYGRGVCQSRRLAMLWLMRSASQGEVDAQLLLGHLLSSGRHPKPDAAMPWLDVAIRSGNPAALAVKAHVCMSMNRCREGEALALLTRSAELGSATGMHELGQFYYQGEGVSKNLELAIKWTRAAARKQHPGAESLLGYFYSMGIGVEKNEAAAWNLFERSARHGDAVGALRLAESNEKGLRGKSDLTTALHWYMVAEREGEKSASGAIRRLSRQVSKAEATEARWKFDEYYRQADPLKQGVW